MTQKIQEATWAGGKIAKHSSEWAYVLRTLSCLVFDADAGNHRVNHAVVYVTEFLPTHTTPLTVHTTQHPSWHIIQAHFRDDLPRQSPDWWKNSAL